MNLLDGINQEQDNLLAQFNIDAGTGAVDSLFGALPVAPVDPNVAGEMNDQPPMPQAAAAAPVTQKDGVAWEPGVGFVNRKGGNAAQEWEAAAGSPAPNFAAIQKHNESLLDPNRRNPQGGPGQTSSTQRYYTRKLTRAIFMNKGSSPESVAQAHMDLRFGGASSSPSGLGSDSAWNDLFVRNENNNFGEGDAEHKGTKLVNEPGGGSRFRYLTDLV